MATFQNTMHVSEYSGDGKLFALLSAEGKLKIWDTETSEFQREFVPNYHLNAPFTCFTWITVNGSVSPRKTPQKKNASQNTTEYIALGTRSGNVCLYSYSKGEIEHNLKGDGHQGSITAICRGKNNILYTCGEDCCIVTWNLETCTQIAKWEIGNEKPSSIVYLTESNRLLVAGRQLYLWSIENEELEKTFTGHSSNVLMLKYVVVKSKEFILSASKTDRVLTLWRIKQTNNRPNAYSYLMDNIACSISFRIDDDDKLEIGAVTQSGALHVYTVEHLSKKNDELPNKPMKPQLTIEIANDSTQLVEPIPICTVSMKCERTQKKIQIGYGDRQIIRFELIVPDFSEKRQVLVRGGFKSKPMEANKRTINALKTITPIINFENVEYQSKDAISRKGQKTIEIPMETRLENLTFDSIQSGEKQRNITQLLIQALHSHDAGLLREVFLNNSNKDEALIRSTLKRLPPQYIGSLVTELTSLAQKKTTQVHTAVLWLKHLLQTQSSQLMAIGSVELFSIFGPFLGMSEYRANTYQQLNKLSGRLDLLVNQIKQNTDHDIVEDADLLVYEDKDSDDSDALPQDEESSDDQWEDGEEENEMDLMDDNSGEGMDLVENGENGNGDEDMESDDDDDDDDDGESESD